MQVAYGLATSTEVAYYTYIYAKVSREHYQKVTSFTRVSLLMGRFLAGVAAQILASTQILDYRVSGASTVNNRHTVCFLVKRPQTKNKVTFGTVFNALPHGSLGFALHESFFNHCLIG